MDDEKKTDEEEKQPVPSETEQKSEKTDEQKDQDEEALKKQEHLSNLQKAIDEAEAELQLKRKAKKAIKSEEQESPDELPKIDLSDPGSKAWDKHIKDNVNPLQEELDKEKKEVRTFALKEFLGNKPALAKNPDKLKELMDTYDRLKTASERTKEGVLLDLNKAYAAVFHDELIQAANARRFQDAEQLQLEFEPAVSHGSGGYSQSERARAPKLTQSDLIQLAKWGMTPQEWIEMKNAQDKKQE